MISSTVRKQSVLNKENHLGKSPNRYRTFRPKTNSQKTIFFEFTNTNNKDLSLKSKNSFEKQVLKHLRRSGIFLSKNLLRNLSQMGYK